MTTPSQPSLLERQLELITALKAGIEALPGQTAEQRSLLLGQLSQLASLAKEQHAAAEEALQSESLMTLMLEGSGTGTWDRDLVNDTVSYSAGWAALLGYPEGLQSTMQDALERVHPDDRPAVLEVMQETIAGKRPVYHVEHRIRCRDGSYRWMHSRGRIVSRDATGRALRMVGTTVDVTARKQAEAALHEMATQDALTGLPNRRQLLAAMEQELARLRRSPNHTAAILMCDLDHFKSVNDSLGHAIGDRALVHFADLMRNESRQIDTVGRLGGEEFAILLVDTSVTDAMHFSERLRSRLEQSPLALDQGELRLTVSIGIAELTGEAASIESALLSSDAALYLAKANGRNRVEAADPPRR